MDKEILLPKLIVTGIDGVWTDGCVYSGPDGEWLKRYNTSDSAGILLAHHYNIAVCMISDEESAIDKKLAEQLKVDYLLLGCKNKLNAVEKLCRSHRIALGEVAYIGAQVSDYMMLKVANWSGVPSSAPEFLRRSAVNKLVKRGGEGAFTEFVERVLKEDLVEEAVSHEMKKW